MLRFVGGRYRLAVVERHRVFLAVDRLGTLPWYVSSPVRGGIVFASSLDELVAHPAAAGGLSAQAIAEYFHFQVLYGRRTPYRGVERLRPGECLLVDEHGITREEHGRLSYAAPRRCSRRQERELREELRRVLRDSVQREIADAGGHIGAFLSGGLDSSTVVGLATEVLGRSVDTFTVRFDVPGYDESAYATIAARRFGARQHIHTVTPSDMAEDLERIAELFDEPFGNSSAAGSIHCAKLARQHGVHTMLAGDGGDELFGGGELFVLMQRFELFQRLPAPARTAIERALAVPGVSALPWLHRASSYVRRAKIPMPARARSYEYLAPATWSEVFEPAFIEAIDADELASVVENAYVAPPDADSLQRHLRYALRTVSASDDLPKVLRTCAAHGVEARFPLLGDDVMSFVASVPSNVLVKHLHERAFYREALRDFLPSAILSKRKHCFSHPLAAWMTGPTPLRYAIVEALRSFANRGIVRRDLLSRLIAEPTLLRRPELTALVWYMAVLERWLSVRKLESWS
ncbi:MAG TPA: asparagine synthetase B family protein [Gemmatimonadaceae bacterium]|nr:asparagine synthetase B family protein [Gemmatimonadaceae bacterium]